MNDTPARQLLEQAALSVRKAPPGFIQALFGRAAAEDVETLSAAALAQLAEGAYQQLAGAQTESHHKIRLFNPAEDGLRGLTILEAVNDDMPFLLDSTLAELQSHNLSLRLVAHPVFTTVRNGAGEVTQIAEEGAAAPTGAARESLIHIQIDRIADPQIMRSLETGLARVYADVGVCVRDWRAMRTRVEAAVGAFKANPPPLPVDEIAEAVQFLEWLAADNFVFLGLRDYRFAEGAASLDAVGGSGLGLLRDPDVKVLRRGAELVTVTPEVMEFLREPHALIITKANVKSRVHRRAHLDYIGIKLFKPNGALAGELRLVGLFTSTAYTRSTQSIPYIRHKVARVLAAANLDNQSHSGKVLSAVLENYPRDELFQVDAGTLAEFAGAIAALDERPRLRVLARPDRFDRFVSILAFIPRDRFDTAVRVRIGDYLARVFSGRLSAYYTDFPEGPLARVHFIIGRDGGATPRLTREALEAGVGAIVRTWSDGLHDELSKSGGAAQPDIAARYARAFSAGYMEAFPAREAVADVALIDRLSQTSPLAVDARSGVESPDGHLRLKVFSRGRPMPLSERVPMMEHMGFQVISERTFEITPAGAAPGDAKVTAPVWLHDMDLLHASGKAIDSKALAPRIEALLAALFQGLAESDGYDALVIEAGLGWRDIAMLRTLSLYLRQTRIRYSQDYMWETLCRHAGVAKSLVQLIHARFDPALPGDRAAAQAAVLAAVDPMLGAVASLDEDRILRRFLNLAQAAVRTNFFQTDAAGKARETITFKFESQRIIDLPLPRPLFEITVYSPRVEGIHLRFGKVARGGLRWSDRPQDFRTEILGLVKAQQVKNAVIVPVGAKGGFVAKDLPAPSNRDAWMAEGIAAYKIFINSLLDLTDNIGADGTIVPPANTVRHDTDDPYLVVAADKGTATFSDIANGLSLEHGHWLGDAFASGGSVGYDHKKMGITARGAWEAVKRHFRELGRDIQTTPFTTVGVGDMSGDVFGNGMLLSPETRLIAAFDHRDIFIDPAPDCAVSLAERARLFALPRSSWQDYKKELLSKGGGIYPRSAKEITLSPEAVAALGLRTARTTPQELMICILKAEADLLWFGGIGTYIRSGEESDDAVGDRANDAIRIIGRDLRCKVIGEGANLGLTQRGRIEAARAGVALNTDAIDNSAGVNTSDVEVNIKIALSTPLRAGAIDEAQRNTLLASMTDEVGALVLRNNYQQTLALSLARRRGADDTGFAIRLMQSLESAGRLDRGVEYLPSDLELNARARAGESLTRPELSVLLAYAKLSLNDELLASSVPDDVYLARELARYFPRALCEKFPDAIETHRLRREIVATALANAIINRGGPTLITRIADETGADAAAAAHAFAAVRDSYSLTDLNSGIDALDAKIPGDLQLDLYARVQGLLMSRLVWFIRNVDFAGGLEAVVSRFKSGVETLASIAADLGSPTDRAAMDLRRSGLTGAGVPEPLARRLAALDRAAAAPDIVLVAEGAKARVGDVAAIFFAADEAFGLGGFIAAARGVAVNDYYDRLALDRAVDQIEVARRRLAAEIVKAGPGTGAAAVEAWIAARGPDVARIRKAVGDISASGLTLSKMTVVASLLGDLTRV